MRHSNYSIVRVKIMSGELVPSELGTVKERYGDSINLKVTSRSVKRQ